MGTTHTVPTGRHLMCERYPHQPDSWSIAELRAPVSQSTTSKRRPSQLLQSRETMYQNCLEPRVPSEADMHEDTSFRKSVLDSRRAATE